MKKIELEFEKEVLLKEYERINQEINNYLSIIDRNIGFAMLILGGGAAYGLKENLRLVLLIVPFGVFGIYIYALHLLTAISALGGYKKGLEEKINSIIGKNLLMWEIKMSQKHLHNRFIYAVFSLILFVFLLFTMGAGLNSLLQLQKHGFLLLFIFGFIYVFLFGTLIYQIINMTTSFNRVYNDTITRS